MKRFCDVYGSSSGQSTSIKSIEMFEKLSFRHHDAAFLCFGTTLQPKILCSRWLKLWLSTGNYSYTFMYSFIPFAAGELVILKYNLSKLINYVRFNKMPESCVVSSFTVYDFLSSTHTVTIAEYTSPGILLM